MAVVIKPITVEVSKPNVFQAIAAKQNDCNSRFLKVTFVNEGEKIFISPSATVTINATRNDGESESFFGTVNSDGTATVPIHSWILELVGYVDCDVSIIEADSKLTCTTFSLLIEKATNNSEDISQDPQYDVLVNLIAEVQKTKENVSNAIKDSVSGTSAIRLDGASPLEHDISVKAMQEVKILGAGEVVCEFSGFSGDYDFVGIDIWDYENLNEENQAKLYEIAEIIEENEFGFSTIRFTDGSYIADTYDGAIDINGLKVGDVLLFENIDCGTDMRLSKLTEIGTEQVPLTNGEVVTEKIIARGEARYDPEDGFYTDQYPTGWYYINGEWFYVDNDAMSVCSTRVLKTTTENKSGTVTRYGKNLWDNANAIFSDSTQFTKTETGFVYNGKWSRNYYYVYSEIPMKKGVTYNFYSKASWLENNLDEDYFCYLAICPEELDKNRLIGGWNIDGCKVITYTADKDYPNAKFYLSIYDQHWHFSAEDIMVYVYK